MEEDVAFEDLYRRLRPRLATALLLVGGNTDAAQDAADEALARAVVHWGRVSLMASPEGWVYRVAMNVLRRNLRRAALEQRLLLKRRVPGVVPEPAGEVWAVVAALAPRQRTAVVLRYVADLDEAEIADSMGISRSTVSSTLTDARRRLAALLADTTTTPTAHA